MTASAEVISGPSKGTSPFSSWISSVDPDGDRGGSGGRARGPGDVPRSSIETHGTPGASGGHCRGPALRTGPTLHVLQLSTAVQDGALFPRRRHDERPRPPEGDRGPGDLPAQTEALDQRAVARDVRPLQVLQQAPTLAH